MNPWYHRSLKAVDKKHFSRRTLLVGIFFTFLFTAIGLKAYYLQVLRGPWLSEVAARQYEKSVDTWERRGTIYDSRHRELAVSIDVMSISAAPQRIADIHSTSKVISQVLDIDGGDFFRKLLTDRKFVWVKRHVSPKDVEKVRRLDLDGISFVTEHSRFYPNKILAAQLLGFTGVDGNGLEGVEYRFDRYLRGTSGRSTILKDALGRRFESDVSEHPDPRGHNIVLTIDQTIQYIAEKALEEGIQAFSAESGMVVVMAPRSGAILALVNYPYFNPNTFGDYDKASWRNRVVTDPFEPGSTLKIFTAAAALESGLIQSDTLFYAENGEYQIGNNTIHDSSPHTWLSLTQVIKLSSNIGAIKISEAIGPEALFKTLTDFGFNEKTGINCPGETVGMLLPYRQWSRMDASAQGISVSAIQLARAVAAIANDGVLMRPYIVKAITDSNGSLVERFQPEKIRQAISPEFARLLGQMMETVVAPGGTGTHAALAGYRVCGKTGTAQKVDGNSGYAEDRFTASFVGFAPVRRPEIAILVVIDEPKENHYGGVVAAPVFKKIALETLDYMNIIPRRETKQLRVSYQPGITG